MFSMLYCNCNACAATYLHGPNYGHKTWSDLETHHEKSSEIFIPVLEHGRLHLGSCRASVLKILIKIAISHGPN